MAQSIKRLTLDLGSGHDLTVREFQARIRLHADSTEPAWDSLCFSAPPLLSLSLSKININLKTILSWGAWVAQSVKCLTIAQVMISRFVSSNPASGSMLTAQSLLGILSPTLSAPPLLTLSLSFKTNK